MQQIKSIDLTSLCDQKTHGAKNISKLIYFSYFIQLLQLIEFLVFHKKQTKSLQLKKKLRPSCLMFQNGQSTFQETLARRCSVKKVFLEISQNSQENICARVSFVIKLQALAQVFSFLRTAFLSEHLRWLLLHFKNVILNATRFSNCVRSFRKIRH